MKHLYIIIGAKEKKGWVMEGTLLCLAPTTRAGGLTVTAPTEGELSGLAQAVMYGSAIINSSID